MEDVISGKFPQWPPNLREAAWEIFTALQVLGNTLLYAEPTEAQLAMSTAISIAVEHLLNAQKALGPNSF